MPVCVPVTLRSMPERGLPGFYIIDAVPQNEPDAPPITATFVQEMPWAPYRVQQAERVRASLVRFLQRLRESVGAGLQLHISPRTATTMRCAGHLWALVQLAQAREIEVFVGKVQMGYCSKKEGGRQRNFI